MAVHEKEARAKEALNSFVWAREGEHEGANYHQCQERNQEEERKNSANVLAIKR